MPFPAPEPVREEDLDLAAMADDGFAINTVFGGVVYSLNDRLNSLTHIFGDPEYHAIVARYRRAGVPA